MKPTFVAPSALGLAALLALGGCPREPAPGDRDARAAPPASSTPAPVFTPAITPWDEKVREDAISAGANVLRKHQCTRCHVIDTLEAPSRPLHCTGCHLFLKGLDPGKEEWAKLEKKYGKGILERYQHNIQHLQQLPSLTLLGNRVRGDWVLAFLREPYDLRPVLGESMIRHALSPAEINTLGRYFAAVARAPDPTAPDYAPPPAPPGPDQARLEQGKKLFSQKGCAACHTFGNVSFGVTAAELEATRATSALAPNLRHVRDRTRADVLVQWIVDPRSLSSQTTMPAMGVSIAEAEILRDFLLHYDPALQPTPAPPGLEPPKLLDRPISYQEVKEQVLGKICVHCHMNDHEKDPGPGNRGGLGYAGVGLQMRTYEALVWGAVDTRGKRSSMLVPRQGDKISPIVAAMLRRRLEAPRDQVAPLADHALPPYPRGGLTGMPMGLPTMSETQIALVSTWIAQGCRGPTAVTGTPGVFDGYLVPDGPIAKNEGCELRAPDKKRPAWAVETERAAAAAQSASPGASAGPAKKP